MNGKQRDRVRNMLASQHAYWTRFFVHAVPVLKGVDSPDPFSFASDRLTLHAQQKTWLRDDQATEEESFISCGSVKKGRDVAAAS
jgi:hypothetical protein